LASKTIVTLKSKTLVTLEIFVTLEKIVKIVTCIMVPLVITVSVGVPVLRLKVEKHREAWQYTGLSVWVLQYCLFYMFYMYLVWEHRGTKFWKLLLSQIIGIFLNIVSHCYSFSLIAGITAESKLNYELIQWVSQLQLLNLLVSSNKR
jgi:cellulose synthase/poly-beta-1,6-N-acetylglucosamine synthase-like glycosyltransferase